MLISTVNSKMRGLLQREMLQLIHNQHVDGREKLCKNYCIMYDKKVSIPKG